MAKETGNVAMKKVSLKSTATGVNSPKSVLGGSAPTNFAVTPQYKSPMGGLEVSSVCRGGAYSVDVKVETGEATNDKAN